MAKKPTYDELLKNYAQIKNERDYLRLELDKALKTIEYLGERRKSFTRKYSDLT